jgi:hypothetical protein
VVAEFFVALPCEIAGRQDKQMKNVILFLAIVCGGATFVSFSAATHGTNWAGQLCTAASPLCHSPLTLALAATGLVSLWIVVALFSAISDA